MQTALPASPLSPAWTDQDSPCGFFTEDMSPLFSHDDREVATPASSSPLKSQAHHSPDSASALGPSGPIHFTDSEKALNSLMDFLQVTPCQSVAPTPVGSPVQSRKRTPSSPMRALTLPPLANDSLSPEAPSFVKNYRSPQQSPPATSNSMDVHAAFLPPEFYSSHSSTSKDLRPPPSIRGEEHRSKSPFAKSKVMTLHDFSWRPTNVQVHVDCIATEASVDALNLLEEEVQRMMQIITV